MILFPYNVQNIGIQREQQDYLLFLICSIQKRRHELVVLETAGLLCKTMSCGS